MTRMHKMSRFYGDCLNIIPRTHPGMAPLSYTRAKIYDPPLMVRAVPSTYKQVAYFENPWLDLIEYTLPTLKLTFFLPRSSISSFQARSLRAAPLRFTYLIASSRAAILRFDHPLRSALSANSTKDCTIDKPSIGKNI